MATYGTLKFIEPDQSVRPTDRSLFALAAAKTVVTHMLPLHDARTSNNITRGPAGLDAQGFTIIKHRSALADSDTWFEGQNIEEVYLPEVKDLICSITGGKRAVINNVAFRRKLADKQANPRFYITRGGSLDKEMAKLPRDTPLIYGKEEGGSLEPARTAHIDYSVVGLRRTARECRKDIVEAGRDALEAEDRVNYGETVHVPRYAAYSVWRPVRTVRRDPLAVCDWRSVDKEDLCGVEYRALSDVNDDGEYMMHSIGVLPPKAPHKQRWYWLPEQQADEVLIIKFADTAAELDPNIAGGCPHLSPEIPETEDEEPRLSIEARVLVFW